MHILNIQPGGSYLIALAVRILKVLLHECLPFIFHSPPWGYWSEAPFAWWEKKKKSFLPWKFRSCVLSLEQTDERKTSTATACPVLILFWLSNLSPLAQTSRMLLIKSVAEGKTFASACMMRLVNAVLCPQKLLFYAPREGFLLRMDLLVCGYKSLCKVIISCCL